MCVQCLWLFLFVDDHQTQSSHWPGKRNHGSLSLQCQVGASMMRFTQSTWSPTLWQSSPAIQVINFSTFWYEIVQDIFTGTIIHSWDKWLTWPSSSLKIHLTRNCLLRWCVDNIFLPSSPPSLSPRTRSQCNRLELGTSPLRELTVRCFILVSSAGQSSTTLLTDLGGSMPETDLKPLMDFLKFSLDRTTWARYVSRKKRKQFWNKVVRFYCYY